MHEVLAIVPQRSEDYAYLGKAHLSLAAALRAAGEEAAAVEAGHEALRLASAKQDRAALRRIEAFLHD